MADRFKLGTSLVEDFACLFLLLGGTYIIILGKQIIKKYSTLNYLYYVAGTCLVFR